MKRWLLAVAALLGSAWTCAQADYVLIVYELGPKNKGNQQPQGFGGMGDFMRGRQGGMDDMMRRMRGQQNQGGGGFPGQPNPGPGRGIQGGGFGGGQPGGFQGNPGGGFRGMQPGGGFQGGMGGQGRFGMNPFGMFGSPNLEEPDDDDSGTLKVSAIVEVKKHGTMQIQKRPQPGVQFRPGMQFPKFSHKWGTTGLYDASDIHYHIYTLPPRDAAYKARRETLLGKEGSKDTSGKNANNYLDLAKWVLMNGKVDEFTKIMDELAKIEPDNPYVEKFKQVKADMDRKITKDDAAAYYWQNRLGSNYKVRVDSNEYPHYALLYSTSNDRTADSPEVVERMKMLEENYRAFFYWFVLKGMVRPVPDYRLVAILVDNAAEYQEYHKVFDNVPTADDGFYDRRENIVFFCATPQDEGYEALDKSTKNMWNQGWRRKDLIAGNWTKTPANADPVTIVRNQVLALLLQSMESESELAAVAHDGTMQLLAATGLIPRTVMVPEWVRFGTASFFETPKGAWWQGTGAPSHLYLKKFKDWETKKKLDKPEVELKKVVTDEFFREARKEKVNPDAAWTKARTMTWALTYFLAEEHLEKLLAYYQELANLPRDMEFDDEILLGCFTRAFKIGDPINPNVPKPDSLHRLGMEWFKFMTDAQLENLQAQKEAEEARNAKKASKKNAKAKESEK